MKGVMPVLERRYRETDSASVSGRRSRKYMSIHTCTACDGQEIATQKHWR